MDIYFILYLVVFLFLIYKTHFFGIFKDTTISPLNFAVLFFFKALAVPAFYFVYKKMYGGVENFDAGKFFHDAGIISSYAKSSFVGYLKIVFGLQDDSQGSSIYKECLVHTFNWDNGNIPDYFYNDNRIVIRLHSIFHFVSLGSYFVHALFNSFLSFVGITFLYKALKDFFRNRELFLLLIFCYFPTLWFYTGGVLKEGIAMFVMGASAYFLKMIIQRKATSAQYIYLVVLIFISTLLKPYLLIPATICFYLLFKIQESSFQHKSIIFFCSALSLFILANMVSLIFKQKSLSTIAEDHQRLFADAAKGGIFLLDKDKFVRLEYDYSFVKKISGRDSLFSIKKGIPFVYWNHSNQADTLYCKANTDTLNLYKLVYDVPKSGSNIYLGTSVSEKQLPPIAEYFYYSLFFPFFINAKGILQIIASFENLLILLALLLFIKGVFQNKRPAFPAIVFILFALGLCLLIGATTPNSGAIFRYRSPVVIFILIAAIYYSPSPSKSTIKTSLS